MAIGLTTLQVPKPEQLLEVERIGTGKIPIAYPHLEHMCQLSLPDSRQIEYAVFGATNGQPVLYFHNELLGNIWPRKFAEYAAIRGLKIIVRHVLFMARARLIQKDVITVSNEKVDPANDHQIGAPMSGLVSSVEVSQGESVKAGQTLVVIEAMKMQSAIPAEHDGVVERIPAYVGQIVESKDLLCVISK